MSWTRKFATGSALLILFSGISLAQKPLTRIAFGSCARESKPQPFWEVIVDEKPDLFIWTGDNIYGDTEDMEILNKKYGQLGDKPGYQLLKETCPILSTWDDHDYGLNDAGKEYSQRRQSAEIFLDFFEVPLDSPRRKHAGIYGVETFGPIGKQVQVIMLDTRYFRDALNKVGRRKNQGPYAPSKNAKATVLGEAQWAWLENVLRKPAALRVVVTSIQLVSSEHGWETWGNFPNERKRFLKLLADTKANGVICISGDRHMAELSCDKSAAYPLFEMTSSGLSSSGGGNPAEPNAHRFMPMYQKPNFGWLEIDWSQQDPELAIMARSTIDATPVLQHRIRLSALQPIPDTKEAN